MTSGSLERDTNGGASSYDDLATSLPSAEAAAAESSASLTSSMAFMESIDKGLPQAAEFSDGSLDPLWGKRTESGDTGSLQRLDVETIRLLTTYARQLDEVSRLWYDYAALISAPKTTLVDLTTFESTYRSALASLEVQATASVKLLEVRLDRSTIDHCHVFTAAYLAGRPSGEALRNRISELLIRRPAYRPTLIAGLAWSELTTPDDLAWLLESTVPVVRAAGLLVCSQQGIVPEAALEESLAASSDQELACCALRVVGELALESARDIIEARLVERGKHAIAPRCWAARSAALLGDRDLAVDVLRRFSLSRAVTLRRVALEIAPRLPKPGSRQWFRSLVEELGVCEEAVAAVTATGLPHYGPALIRFMAEPELKEAAAYGFAMITGFDPLAAAMTADDGQDPVSLAQHWWEHQGITLERGQRHLLGQPIGVEHCRRILDDEALTLRQRTAAALEYALLVPQQPLLDLFGPSERQRRRLAQCRF
ncbi:MAG: hypothetical protein ACFCBW_21865 [Candidatus Competibacterales bacterium]